ncbi:BON domain-containing protein [Panacibacter sp. DH6]|uniref:BON domain-containing protein n=2 Tax=Panacibacter microcysteis TaxID=2793269 RepID=A0A931E8K8_9BACT|nr:BON domain-containing protein [Panacibacter microcysteis]
MSRQNYGLGRSNFDRSSNWGNAGNMSNSPNRGNQSGRSNAGGSDRYNGGYNSESNYGSGSQDRGDWEQGSRYGSNVPDYYGSNYGTSGDGYNNRYGNAGQPSQGSRFNQGSPYGNSYGNNSQQGTGGMYGGHRGKGPKGYERSEQRIKEDISDRLMDDDDIDASEIDITVKAGEVTLTGTVSDKQTKRRIEDMIESMSGVKNVQNNLRVQSSQQESGRTKDSSKQSNGQSNDAAGKQSATTSSAVKGEREKVHHN